MRTLRRLLTLLLGLLLLQLLLTALALFTGPGMHAGLTLAQRLLPGSLSYRQLDGSLAGDLTLTGLRYHSGGLSLTVKRLHLAWQPRDLLSGELHISDLEIDSPQLQLPPSQTTTSTAPLQLPDVSLPLAVSIDRLQLDNLELQRAGAAKPTVIEHLALRARTDQGKLQLESLSASALQAQVTLHGTLTPRGSYPLQLQLDWHLHGLPYGPLQGSGHLSGALGQTLTLHQQLGGFVSASLDAEARHVLTDPSWNVHLQLHSTNLGTFNPTLAGSPLDATLQTQGTLQAFTLTAQADSNVSRFGPLTARLDARGNTRELHLKTLELSSAQHPLRLTAQADIDLPRQTLTAHGQWQQLAWPLTGPARYASPQGTFDLSGTLQNYQLALDARLDGSELGQLVATVRASGNRQQVKLTRFEVNEPAAQQPLKLQAHGEIALKTLAFSAKGEWQRLRWPLRGTPQYQSPSGSFDTSGNLQDYRFLLQAAASGSNLPYGDWRIQGQGSSTALKQGQIRGQTLHGTLTGSVQARWRPSLSWRAELQGESLDPGVKWPNLKGELGFQLVSDGAVKNGVLDGTAQLKTLHGTLAGKPVAGQARLQLAGRQLTIDTLQLKAGAAGLQAKGGLGTTWNLDWQLDIPQLQGLVPGGRGSIRGSGRIEGARDQPRATLDLSVAQLQLADNRLDQLQGKIRLDLSGASRSQIDIQGRGLAVAGQQWQRLRVNGAGTPADHSLEAELDGKAGQFRLAIQGGLKGSTWQGRLTRLSARQTRAGDWQLAQPAALQAGPKSARLGQTCLVSQPSRLCLEGNWQATSGAQGKVVLDRLTLTRFRSLLPADLTLTNSLSGQIDGSYSAAGKPAGKVALTLSAGTLKAVQQGRPIELKLGQSSLTGTLDASRAHAELRLDLDQLGKVASTLAVTDPLGQGRLDGRLQASLQHFDVISKLAPQLQDLQGHIDADLGLTGTYKAPVARGQIKLADGAVSLPDAGTHIQQIQLEVTGAGTDALRFTGSAHSGKGQLNLSGLYRLGNQQLNLAVKGENFEALNTFSQVLISPDLQLAVTPKSVQLSGEVKVPNANIAPPPNMESRVTSSSDVVIVRNANGKPPPQPLTRQVSAHLRVVLGDHVWVSAGGFRGQLKGDLLIDQSPQLAPRASGSVEVVAGNYKIYGQELNIERGRLLFSGGPVDNPGLDLRVSRAFDNGDTTVGAQINGSLRQPQLKLFSTPTMANGSILSYLVFGHGPGTNNSSQNALLLQAAAALGASGGSFLTKGLAKDLGVDLKFTGGSTPQDSAFTIGKYLAPNLYVSYGIGLFDAVSKFSLNYQLSKHLSVESSSTGTSNSVDLLYTIQH